ncbi:MAG: hypothetical protein RMJ97_05105 [Raineya sp.]|nr:hypothetical protein [Raineya sp.]MDW8296246.1 hypothetical protein [Raineya sp.]
MKKHLLAFCVLGLVIVGCKKKQPEPTTLDLLTAHLWISKQLELNITVAGTPAFAENRQTDSLAVEFKREGTAIFYQRNPANGVLTEISRQGYSLSADEKKIEFTNPLPLLPPTLQAQITLLGIRLPTSVDIEKLTRDELILKGSFQQNITLPDVPFPVPIAANYRFSFGK